MPHSSLYKKLDIEEYIKDFKKFLARDKDIAMIGDTNLHFKFIKELSSLEFKPPKNIPNLNNQLNRLKKQAILSIDEIYSFVQILEYFNYFKTLTLPPLISKRINDIVIPPDISNIITYFTDKGDLNSQKDEELLGIENAIVFNKKAIKESLYNILKSSNLSEFLVDSQIHFINNEETLLVRGGFSNAIKASVVARSSGGFFYILPQSLSDLKAKESALVSQKELIILRYCKEFSQIMSENEKFLSFANKEFDRFDHYQARVFFARTKDYEFVLPQKNNKVILSDFTHPALHDPVPISLSFDKKILLITGVNAGGKTMLLKSILSSVFMSKYLLPFRCNIAKTQIGHFDVIDAIIDDPQSVKNDISTFAGRMVEFSKLFDKKNAIIGIDEIELGTDSDEAASLFRVLLEELAKKDVYFVVTTHHKRLASLLAPNRETGLIAAMFDEEKRVPTYTFLEGSIGKSYAFETALRYGIPKNVVSKVIKLHGEDKERLNELIENQAMLEVKMRQKLEDLEIEKQGLDKKEKQLLELEEKLRFDFDSQKTNLEIIYKDALQKAQEAMKQAESKEGRRLLNDANRVLQSTKQEKIKPKEPLKIGDRVKYRSHKGTIISLSSDYATIDVDGLKIKVDLTNLKKISDEGNSAKTKKEPKVITTVEKGSASISIKLIGMFGDEAIDKLDRFISDALVHNFSEVQVIHGGGAGILAKLVSEFLKNHPKIKNFYRMPGNLGITIVEL